MKKVLLLLLAMLSVVFAEVKVTLFVEAGFDGLHLYSFPSGDYKCNSKPVDVKDPYAQVYYSSLDSSVFFSIDDGALSSISGDFKLAFWVLSSATHSLGEVIRDQFKLFKECENFVEWSDPEDDPTDRLDGIADTMATLVDSLSKTEMYFIYENHCSYNNYGEPCVYRHSVDYYLPSEIQAIIDAQNGKTALNTRERFRVDFNLSDGHLDVPEQMIGRKFQMYDASGRRHVDDRLQNTLDLPSAPRYIKIKMR